MASQAVEKVVFGQHMLSLTQIFFRSKFSLGVVNIMPVKKGHVLIIPKRRVFRFKDLNEEEVIDLFLSAQKVSKVLEQIHNSTALTLALQDGPDAGQTVSHVHVHLMPREKGDFARNDDVYSEIEKPRPRRSEEDMAKEAEEYAKYFPENEQYGYTLD